MSPRSVHSLPARRLGAGIVLGTLLGAAGVRADVPTPPTPPPIPVATPTPLTTSTPPVEGRWTGSGQGGLVLASGNTQSSSLNGQLNLARIDGAWTNAVYLGGLYTKNAGVLSGERVELRYELDRKISARSFWFGQFDGSRDLFSGFDYRVTTTGGIGYKFIDTDTTHLSATLGAGYQRLLPQTLVHDASGAVTDRINGSAEGNFAATEGVQFEHRLTATTKLTDKLLVTSGTANTAVANDLAIAVSINHSLALSLGYSLRSNSAPAAGAKKLDQVTTANVVYKIS